MLTESDREFIEIYTEFNERYQEVSKYVFKGRQSFDLHSRLVSIRDDWLESITDDMKNECFLLVTIQTTISKAVLKNPYLMPKTPQQRIKLYFNCNNITIPSSRSYTGSDGKKWLKILFEESNNLL